MYQRQRYHDSAHENDIFPEPKSGAEPVGKLIDEIKGIVPFLGGEFPCHNIWNAKTQHNQHQRGHRYNPGVPEMNTMPCKS